MIYRPLEEGGESRPGRAVRHGGGGNPKNQREVTQALRRNRLPTGIARQSFGSDGRCE
jgi:hypothetical protein